MQKLKIKVYLKPHCGWSKGVRAIMNKYGLEYQEIDIVNHAENYAEMVEKTGQLLSPCVEINGTMLADVSGEEVENYLLSNNLVEANSTEATECTSRGCTDHDHTTMHTQTIRFF